MKHNEDAECLQLVAYLDLLQRRNIVVMYAHINNEVYTKSWKQRNRIKAMGSPAGLPDYIIIIQDKLVFIEMKAAKGTVSPKQKQWIQSLKNVGIHAYICFGFEQAKNILESLQHDY